MTTNVEIVTCNVDSFSMLYFRIETNHQIVTHTEPIEAAVVSSAIESQRQVDAIEPIQSVGRFASFATSAGTSGGTRRTRPTRSGFRRLRAQLPVPNHQFSSRRRRRRHSSHRPRKLPPSSSSPSPRLVRRRLIHRRRRQHLSNRKQVLRRTWIILVRCSCCSMIWLILSSVHLPTLLCLFFLLALSIWSFNLHPSPSLPLL